VVAGTALAGAVLAAIESFKKSQRSIEDTTYLFSLKNKLEEISTVLDFI